MSKQTWTRTRQNHEVQVRTGDIHVTITNQKHSKNSNTKYSGGHNDTNHKTGNNTGNYMRSGRDKVRLFLSGLAGSEQE